MTDWGRGKVTRSYTQGTGRKKKILSVVITATLFVTHLVPAAEGAGGPNIISQQTWHDPVLTQNNKWNWDLSNYPAIGGAIEDKSGIRIILFRKPCCKFDEAIAWNPITGDVKYINLHSNNSYVATHPAIEATDEFLDVKLPNEFVIKTTRIPGVDATIFGSYQEIFDQSQKSISKFYVVHKLTKPKTITLTTRDDGGLWSLSFPIEIENIDNLQIVALGDGTILIWTFTGKFLIRINVTDPSYRNVSDRIFILPATPANPYLPPPSNSDCAARQRQLGMEQYFMLLQKH